MELMFCSIMYPKGLGIVWSLNYVISFQRISTGFTPLRARNLIIIIHSIIDRYTSFSDTYVPYRHILNQHSLKWKTVKQKSHWYLIRPMFDVLHIQLIRKELYCQNFYCSKTKYFYNHILKYDKYKTLTKLQ